MTTDAAMRKFGFLRVATFVLVLATVTGGCSMFQRSPVKKPYRSSRYSRRVSVKHYWPSNTTAKNKHRWRLFGRNSQVSSRTKSSTKASYDVSKAKSTKGVVYRLHPGDHLIVYLRGIPNEDMVEDVIDENGYITLSYINRILAAGKTPSELEQAIRKAYLDQKIYKDITVNVVVPSQSFFVRGEVRQPGRYPLMSGVTLLQAIAAAGGYTEFAYPRKVKVVRGETTFYVNMHDLEKHPEKDRAVEAGDVIVVPRSIF